MTKEEGLDELRRLVNGFSKRRKELVRAGSDFNETQLRTDFLNPFLLALGWDVFSRNSSLRRLRDVVHEDTVQIEEDDEVEDRGPSKKPDYALRAGGERKFFVEAKKPSVRIERHKNSAFQVRRYSWNARMSISVLTNFDKLGIYDCQRRPEVSEGVQVARLRIYDHTEHVSKFDEIYDQLSCDSVYLLCPITTPPTPPAFLLSAHHHHPAELRSGPADP